mgnify:CR=1 FL=1
MLACFRIEDFTTANVNPENPCGGEGYGSAQVSTRGVDRLFFGYAEKLNNASIINDHGISGFRTNGLRLIDASISLEHKLTVETK